MCFTALQSLPRATAAGRSSLPSSGHQCQTRCSRLRIPLPRNQSTCGRRGRTDRHLRIRAIDAAQHNDCESQISNIFPKSRKLKIAVLGFGNFGQFLAKAFVRQGHLVMAHSRSDYSLAAQSIGASFFSDPHDLCEQHPDVILLCTSIISAETVLRSLPIQRLRRSTLFVDVLSVKEFPKNIFLQFLPHHFDILCTHPMFGPESGKGSWRGLPFVFDKVRIGDEESRVLRAERFLDIFAKEGCRMVEMSCAEHDRHAAGSQFITHTMGRVLEKLGLETTPINTKGYETLLDLVKNTASDSFDLYYGLFMYNKNAMEQLVRLDFAFESLKKELFGHLHNKLRKQLFRKAEEETGERVVLSKLPKNGFYALPSSMGKTEETVERASRLSKLPKNGYALPSSSSSSSSELKAKLEVPKFTGKEDPEIHVKTLHQSGRMMGLSGDEKCLLFFQTLRGRAAEWFHNLPAGEIDSFDELAEVFQEKFKENCTKRKKFTYLSTAGQRELEDLTKFLTRWKDEVDKVEEMDDKTAMSLLVSGLRSGELYKEFCRRPPQSYQEAYNTAWDYADAEAQVSSKREAEQGHSKGKVSLKKEITLPGKIKAEVMEVKPVKTEKKLTGEKQWTEKYCSFHKTDSHNTAECNSVKGVIKQMIEAGEIDPEYLAQAKQKKNQWVRPEGQPAEQNKKKKTTGKEHLQVIYGAPEGGDSASQRKKWGRELYVGTVALNPRSKQARREPITFTDRDLPATGEDHNDPLVITMDMGGVDVSRVLVDTGSSVNVLYLDAFEKLKLCRTRLEPLKTPLSRFTGDSVEAEGSILLTCELGTGDQVVQKQMRFVVVNIKCVHNAILGQPGINKVRGVISMAHLCMKFYTPGGIGQVRGDQKKARHCYLEAVKKMTKAFERVTLVSQEEERSKLELGDETEQIVLREAFPERVVRIGRDLPGGLRDEIISVLWEYVDIFA
ncbi:unnamed protein product [Cuscuta campestris]|uniref:Prephenate/arogenate dehydrogenase domain-containing protein n=1 Tax=Cuscuta campestris TaxID=132261 RepID=A0A484L337_9ASTE|nr:unnamed protein product [Cuscuta campestris]